MSNRESYNIVNSETTHIGRFDIVYDQIEREGGVYPYSYVKMHKGVGILGLYGDYVILLKQYRYIWDKWIYEIPGGMVEDGEDIQMAAIREFEEETGYVVDNILYLGTCYPSVGSTTEEQYLYVVRCSEREKQTLDELEKINVHLVKMEDFEKMIRNNDFSHGMGLAAWCKYALLREKV